METLIEILQENAFLAILVSLLVSVIIAVLGVVPSFFITMANISVFGFIGGIVLSICGESLGATVSFYLYRAGFKKVSSGVIKKNKTIEKIVNANTKKAMGLIFSFRLFPYIPSGVVTYAGAMGNIKTIEFTIASTLGKIPALIIEAYIATVAISSSNNMKITLAIISLVFIGYMLKKILKNEGEE